MPYEVLCCLSVIARIFCIYSLLCFLYAGKSWRFYLRIVGMGNLVYCSATIGLIIYFYRQLTALGLIYFVLEIMVIAGLAALELTTASNNRIKDRKWR